MTAYSIYPYGGAASVASSATLLWPTSAWKNDYIVVNAGKNFVTTADNFVQSPVAQVISTHDETEVTIVPSVFIEPGLNVDSAENGKPHTWTLQRGEVLQFTQRDELTGSRLSSTHPVAVFGGHQCFFFPSSVYNYCDTSQNQLFPIEAWGNEYAAVPHAPRREDGVPEDRYYRLVGAVEGTVLTYEPKKPLDAPDVLSVNQTVTFTSTTPFVVKSQEEDHPFFVYTYMAGSQHQGFLHRGDPEFVNVVPTGQYLDHYVFFVDPTYPDSTLVVTRARTQRGQFHPVTLDCAGELEGFMPIDLEGKYEYLHVPLTRGFDAQAVGSGTCTYGRREMSSNGPFTVTVWGTGYDSSYAYPAGVGSRKLNAIELGVH